MEMPRASLLVVPIALFVIGAIGASVAHAASLGGLSVASLWVWSAEADIDLDLPPPEPEFAACDDFSGGSGPLDGRVTPCGATWSVASGNWSLGNDILRSTGRAGLATLPAGSSDMTVSVDVIDGHANNRRGGVVVAGSDTTRLVVLIEGSGGLRLQFVDGNSTTSLEYVNIPTAAVPRLSVTRSGTVVTVRVDGEVHISHMLTAAQSGLLTGTQAGLTKLQGPPAEFDRFEVTTP